MVWDGSGLADALKPRSACREVQLSFVVLVLTFDVEEVSDVLCVSLL